MSHPSEDLEKVLPASSASSTTHADALHPSSSDKTAPSSPAAGAPRQGPPGPPRFPPKHLRTKIVLTNLLKAGASFQIVFWICALWLFGSLYKGAEKTHRLTVLVADFDGADVGSALLTAVASFNGQKTMPTFVTIPANSTSPEDMQHRVFDGEHWGAIYSTAGATDRFNAAIASDSAATSYNAAEALVYTGLEVRYNTVWSGFVLNNLNKVLGATTAAFNRQTVAPLVASGTTYSAAESAVLVNPVSSTYVNLTPFAFGTRIVLNTIGFVFPSLFAFFFLMGVNTLGTMTGWYKGMTLAQHVKFRTAIGAVWTVLAALSVVGWYLCFDEAYEIKAKNFFALWAVEWFYIWITWDLFDIATAYVPPQFIAHIVVFYIIAMSVTAVLYPIQLMNNFFRFQYAFPAHATWSLMITIFGNGAVSTLYNIGILAAWFVVAKVGLFFSLRKRVRDHAEVVVQREEDR
ncbi:hypothetical protein JCM10207_008842 [Rhodosporidiobolus poonsookiae]